MNASQDKVDLMKSDKLYYQAPQHPVTVELPELAYLSIEGEGSPDGEGFASSAEALYKAAYSAKALSKAAGQDYVVPRLEGLWWVDGNRNGLEVPKEEWRWKLLIRLPDFVSEAMVETALVQAAAKNKDNALIGKVSRTLLKEGTCVQMLHVGPYATEPETLGAMYAYMKREKLVHNGLHHEIYISDPRRSAPEKMKTILRQPVDSES
ncbi:GyrI-like domain-containing protein [Cohnella soli]|uniref:GyrI-like domain-containing protein n=1 Tax=Cohnella soli TaxID=425005 RepID=A0ABW0HQM0_9BACL